MKALHTLLASLIFSSAALISPASTVEGNSQETALRIAREAVAEREQWPNGGDYKVSTDTAGWRVTAWRIDFPNHEGSARYAGDGFRVIHIDRDGALRKYSRE